MLKRTNEIFQAFGERPIIKVPLVLLLLISPFIHGLYGEQFFLPFFLFITVLFIISLCVQIKNRELKIFDHPLDWAILVLLLSFVISLINAVSIRSAIFGIMRFSSYVMMFWLCFQLARQPKGLTLFSITLYVAGIGMALFGLLVDCNIIKYLYMNPGDRITGTFDYANTFGIYIASISIVGWSLVLSSKDRIERALISGGNTILLIAMLGSLSRGTWVLYPFAVLLFWFLIGRGQRIKSLIVWLSSLIPAFILGKLFLQHTPTPDHFIFLVLGFVLSAGLQYGGNFAALWFSNKNLLVKIRHHYKWILLIGIILLLSMGLIFSLQFGGFSSHGPFWQLTKISINDSDLQLRLEFNKDAIKIIKDHPFIGIGPGGWEAVYHKYASHLYWSDKPHNYFLQIGVESGIIGLLALISIWLLFIRLVWDYYKAKNIKDSSIFWACATACFLLGAHSIMDFDMSYSAIALLLFGLMGALEGQVHISSNEIEKSVNQKNRNKSRNIKQQADSKGMITIGLALATAFILLIPAASFWAGYKYFRSAQAIMNQDPNQALVLFNKSLQYDSLNAYYWNQYATFLAAVAVTTQQPSAFQQALIAAEKAVEMDPYNLVVLNGANSVYLKLGEYDRAVTLGDIIINANPRDPAAYENLAICHILKGLHELDSGKLDEARKSWEQSLLVNNRVPADIEAPAVGLHYTSGQALILLGNRQQGEKELRQMLTFSGNYYSLGLEVQQRSQQVSQLKVQALIWLAALLDDQPESQQLKNMLGESHMQEVEKAKSMLSKSNLNKTN